MKRSKPATWNFERQYKSSWKHETNFNNTLNHTMENLISKYMSGVHFTLAVRLAMQVHSGTTYVCYLWWHTHIQLNAIEMERQWERQRRGTVIMMRKSRYVLFGDIQFSYGCRRAENTNMNTGIWNNENGPYCLVHGRCGCENCATKQKEKFIERDREQNSHRRISICVCICNFIIEWDWGALHAADNNSLVATWQCICHY